MDHDKIVNTRILTIAQANGCTVEDVYAALDRHPIELDRDMYLKRTLALELIRLDQLEMVFGGKALRERDVAAGALMVKIAERRATLLGLNPPIGHAVQVIQHESTNRRTSIEQARARLDEFMGIAPRSESDAAANPRAALESKEVH